MKELVIAVNSTIIIFIVAIIIINIYFFLSHHSVKSSSLVHIFCCFQGLSIFWNSSRQIQQRPEVIISVCLSNTKSAVLKNLQKGKCLTSWNKIHQIRYRINTKASFYNCSRKRNKMEAAVILWVSSTLVVADVFKTQLKHDFVLWYYW